MDGPPVGVLQTDQLAVAADERGREAGHAARPLQRQRTGEPSARDAARLPFGVDRAQVVELECAANGRDCPLAREDLPRRRSLLEPRRDVERSRR